MVKLGVPDKHQLRIARDTIKMPPAIAGIMGGPSIEEAFEIIAQLTGKRDPSDPIATGEAYETPYGWFANPRNAAIQMIPCDSRADAVRTVIRLRGGS